MAQIQDFVPIKLVFADSQDEFEVLDFSFEMERTFAPDGSNVSGVQGGITKCSIDVSDEGPTNFFSSWLTDTSKRQTIVFEFFLTADRSHFNSIRLFQAAIVSYSLQNTKDNPAVSRLQLEFIGVTYTVLDTNIILNA